MCAIDSGGAMLGIPENPHNLEDLKKEQREK